MIALEDNYGEEFLNITYGVTYNINGSVILSISMTNDSGEVVTDTLEGIVTTKSDGSADAILLLDGECVLLSELCGEGIIDNIGFLSNFWKTIKKAIQVRWDIKPGVF